MQDYAIDQVRQHDYPNYVITLFAPFEKRPALWALYAFNFELAKIRSLVNEPMMGLIRMQWWRDAIEKIYRGEVLRHQVVIALHQAIQTTPEWSEQDFIALINAYETDWEIQYFETSEQLWQQAELTGAQLLRMACAVTKPKINEQALTIIGSASYIMKHLWTDQRLQSSNKNSIMNEVFQKINLLNPKLIKRSAAFFNYHFIKWQLTSMMKDQKPNEALLPFYLWRKSIGF